jgi:probable rRNA maturation factor
MTRRTAASVRRERADAALLVVAVDVGVTRSPVAVNRIQIIAREALRAERVSHALLSITLVENRRIAALNKKQLGHAGPTDVISFGLVRAPGGPVIGDIYIGVEVARENALAASVPVREEIARLVVHGVLHVLGYDHPQTSARVDSAMWRRQEHLVKRAMRLAFP